MNEAEIDDVLRKTLDDRRLSRGEKKVLRELAFEHPSAAPVWRARAFHIARATMKESPKDTRAIIEWLDDVTRVLLAKVATESSSANLAEVLFSPGDACRSRITALLRQAKTSADICVFTITDNRLAEPILHAHRRGVRVRIVTDNDKSYDAGSDVAKLAEAGVPVRVDQSDHHMHHKYAVFDGDTVLTGSYNWTRSAAEYNRENVVVCTDPRIVKPFADRFQVLWQDLA
ncbi:MAG: phospholipase D-like domain-containing protein [Myxococcota bacterium]